MLTPVSLISSIEVREHSTHVHDQPHFSHRLKTSRMKTGNFGAAANMQAASSEWALVSISSFCYKIQLTTDIYWRMDETK
jgi:hypothetical protein